MKSAAQLIKEFEEIAHAVHSCKNANQVMPGMLIVADSQLNEYRNSVARASLRYNQTANSPRFLDKVQGMKVMESTNCSGVRVIQSWNYERNGSSETYTFIRDIEGASFRQKAVIRRNKSNDNLSFEVEREELYNLTA